MDKNMVEEDKEDEQEKSAKETTIIVQSAKAITIPIWIRQQKTQQMKKNQQGR
jgi:hypothetical protein